MITIQFGCDENLVRSIMFQYRAEVERYLAGEFELGPAEVSELFNNGRITDPPGAQRNWIALKDERAPGWVKDNDPDTLDAHNDVIVITAAPESRLTMAQSIRSMAESLANFLGITLNETRELTAEELDDETDDGSGYYYSREYNSK